MNSSALTQASLKLQERLHVIEKVRVDLEKEGIEVPGICATGAQSAGKSSTLESISGVPFPRDENLFTVCPCVVSLEVDPSLTEVQIIIATDPDYKTNMEKCTVENVGAGIRKLSDILSPDKRITEDPIYLKIIRREGPVLTLTDLPGIASMSPYQDDIEAVTVSLVTKYIQKPGMINLVVIPGWEDFNNPKALRLAKDHDPLGERTIGVVTKVDSLPSDSDIIEKLTMKRAGDVKLKQGFIAVRNRTKEEVEQDIAVEELRSREHRLFTTDTKLQKLDRSRWGVDTLVNKIVAIQNKCIGGYIPGLVSTLKSRICEAESEMKKLPLLLITPQQKSSKFLDIIRNVQRAYESLLNGEYTVKEKHLHISARFHETAKQFTLDLSNELPNFLGEKFENDLRDALTECHGVNLSNFMSGSVFKMIINEKFHHPFMSGVSALVRDSVDLVKKAMVDLIHLNARNFPDLEKLLVDIVEDILKTQESKVNDFLIELLRSEEHHTFTSSKNYTDDIADFRRCLAKHDGDSEPAHGTLVSRFRDFIESVAGNILASTSRDNDEASIREMQLSLQSYSDVKLARLVDTVPMLVRVNIVYDMRDKFLESAMIKMTEGTVLDIVMAPDPDILMKTEKLQDSLDRLKNLFELVKTVA